MDAFWQRLRSEALQLCEKNPVLTGYALSAILVHSSFAGALSANLARQLNSMALGTDLDVWFRSILKENPQILEAAISDICRLVSVNPACPDHLTAFVTFRGIQAVQASRLAHVL